MTPKVSLRQALEDPSLLGMLAAERASARTL